MQTMYKYEKEILQIIKNSVPEGFHNYIRIVEDYNLTTMKVMFTVHVSDIIISLPMTIITQSNWDRFQAEVLSPIVNLLQYVTGMENDPTR